MTESAGVEPEDEYQDLREAFKRAMREHPFNLTVLPDSYGPGLNVRKMSAFVPVSDELLHPERYPAPVITRRTRLRWWWWEVKDRVQLAWTALRSGRDGIHCDCDY